MDEPEKPLDEPAAPPAPPALPPTAAPSRSLVEARRLWEWFRAPLAIFLISFIGFSLFAWNRFGHQSTDPHFVLLANAFLKGTTEIRKEDVPPGVSSPVAVGKDRHDNDWASWEELPTKDLGLLKGNYVEGSEYEEPNRFETLDGRLYSIPHDRVDMTRSKERRRHYYVSFPPAPAVLMMPLALIQGYHVNDVLFTLWFAAFNVALGYVLLRRLRRLGLTERRDWENVLLSFALGFATVNLWCSVLGQVWFTALVVGLTAMLLFILGCTDLRRPWLAGLALALCIGIRPQLGVAGLLFAGLLFFPQGKLRREGWGGALRDLGLFAAPVVVVALLLFWYNWVRFGNPFVFGHEFLQAGKLDRIVQWGLFNYHFLPLNLTAALTVLPKLSRNYPYITFSLHGMSIFLSMPFLIYLAAPRYPEGDRPSYLWHRALWAAALAVAIPGFFYQNTGWEQYGFRFAMDWIAFLFVLLAMSRRKLTWFFVTLVVLGFLVNAWGAISFKRGPPFDMFYDTWLTP
ncbi:MAG: hypothetical protein HY905_19200 [Deltaproteobacteria bacterium]|nr:hypothetical protein [Deltaproteobacteria bacterium]